MSNLVIVDTSWLLELYRVPGFYQETRTEGVVKATVDSVNDGGELFVTVPVLFEVANHITHVRNGTRRRDLSAKFRNDIKSSFDRESPWTIITSGEDILLRAEDVIQLADRFLGASGPNYSFADISIIDLAEKIRSRGQSVRIMSFDGQLAAYSD